MSPTHKVEKATIETKKDACSRHGLYSKLENGGTLPRLETVS